MWKSAIARAKRIGDHGRKSVPLVKVESGHQFSSINQVSETALRSLDDDDSDDESVLPTTTSDTTTGMDTVQLPETQGMAVVVNEEVVAEPKARRNSNAVKKAAIDARKKLTKARKRVSLQ